MIILEGYKKGVGDGIYSSGQKKLTEVTVVYGNVTVMSQ